MKAMRMEELNQLSERLQALSGAQVQRLHYNEKALQLRLDLEGESHWLTWVLKPGPAFAFVTQERIPLVKKLKKPLSLFLEKHFFGAELVSSEWLSHYGRALRLRWTLVSGESAENFLSLIPGAVNIQVQVGEKSVWAFKPKDIESGEWTLEPSAQGRASEEFVTQWRKLWEKSKQGSQNQGERQLEKKQKALASLEVRLEELQSAPWLEVGGFLKAHGDWSELPHHWDSYVDKDQDLIWNIKNCFAQGKKTRQKLEGALQRRNQLQQEITALHSGEGLPKKTSTKTQDSLLHGAKAKGRTYQLSASERLYVGRSGTENLKLLRRAKPWYLWLHIRDYPGAFGILERPRGAQDPSPETLEEASRAVIAQSLPKGSQGSFEVLYTECRYVRPIKGAKAGQVTVSHERVIKVKVIHD